MLELTSEETRWLTGLAEFDSGNQLAILAVFAGFGIPKSYLDVGCGTGAMVKTARLFGVDAHGVDILPHAEEYLHKQDLNTFCDLGHKFALVTSIEVAEHIAPESAEILCDTFARHVAEGGLLLLTAAPPGQIGDGHVNCQPKAYWRERLEKRGLVYDDIATKRLYGLWQRTFWATHWCEENLQVFRK